MGRPVAAQGLASRVGGGQSRVGRGGQSSNHEKGGGRVGHHLDIRQFTGPSRIQDPARESAGLVEGRKDLLVLGEAALGLLAEDQLSVILDLEDAPPPEGMRRASMPVSFPAERRPDWPRRAS